MILTPVGTTHRKSRKGKGARKSHSKKVRRPSKASIVARRNWYRVNVLNQAAVTVSGPVKLGPVATADVIPIDQLSSSNSSRLLMYGAAATGALYAILKK